MTVQECVGSGSAYIHIVADELDGLLSESLNAGISETVETTEDDAWHSGRDFIRTVWSIEKYDFKVRTRRKAARNGGTNRNC